MRDALRLAVGTLTVLPVRPPGRMDAAVARGAMLLAPAAGVVPGLAAAAVAAAAGAAGLADLPAAALAVASVALTSRGLHLDGLADTADGLAASYDRERSLEVMRRGDTGPAGAATLVLVLLVQVAAGAQVLAGVGPLGPLGLLAAVVAGRTALPLVCRRGVPAARPSGLGAGVAGTVPVAAAVAVVLVVAALAALVPHAAARGPAAVLAAAVAALLVERRCVRRLGGTTGDVLGACVEAGTTAALVVLATT